jgi:hypothetical protein
MDESEREYAEHASAQLWRMPVAAGELEMCSWIKSRTRQRIVELHAQSEILMTRRSLTSWLPFPCPWYLMVSTTRAKEVISIGGAALDAESEDDFECK